jgi:uncharacterized protein YjbJ (UPF0337 family)
MKKNETAKNKSEKNATSWDDTRKQIKERWNKLTPSQIDEIKEHHDVLEQQLMKTYGYSKEQAIRESKSVFEKKMNSAPISGSVPQPQNQGGKRSAGYKGPSSNRS